MRSAGLWGFALSACAQAFMPHTAWRRGSVLCGLPRGRQARAAAKASSISRQRAAAGRGGGGGGGGRGERVAATVGEGRPRVGPGPGPGPGLGRAGLGWAVGSCAERGAAGPKRMAAGSWAVGREALCGGP